MKISSLIQLLVLGGVEVLGCVSALDSQGPTTWIVDAHGYGKRFVVRADEMLSALLELQRAIHEFAVSLIL